MRCGENWAWGIQIHNCCCLERAGGGRGTKERVRRRGGEEEGRGPRSPLRWNEGGWALHPSFHPLVPFSSRHRRWHRSQSIKYIRGSSGFRDLFARSLVASPRRHHRAGQDPPCYWDKETRCGAAAGGHLDVLKWARSQDPPCHWDPEWCATLAAMDPNRHPVDRGELAKDRTTLTCPCHVIPLPYSDPKYTLLLFCFVFVSFLPSPSPRSPNTSSFPSR
ncbi:hypothetical protein HOP50_07g48810 [Chloropicon primus]|nr:hypothetical protein HOP50_07g48810 [Chloropicon primus]